MCGERRQLPRLDECLIALATSPNTAFAKLISGSGVGHAGRHGAIKSGWSYANPGTATTTPTAMRSLADFVKRQNAVRSPRSYIELNALELSVAATASGGVWCPWQSTLIDRNGNEVAVTTEERLRPGGAQGWLRPPPTR